MEIAILEIHRGEDTAAVPSPDIILQAGDVLRIRCDLEKFKRIQAREGVLFKPQLDWQDEDVETSDTKLVEAVVSPSSYFVGQSLKQVKFRENFGATVLAIRHRGTLLRERIAETALSAGDALLLEVKTERYDQLQKNPSFVITSEIRQETFRKRKLIPAFVIVFGIILTASLGITEIVVSSIVGAVLLILGRLSDDGRSV